MFQTIQIKPGKLRTRRRIRRIVIGTIVGLFAATIVFVLPVARSTGETKQTVEALHKIPRNRLEAAVQSFARDQKIDGNALSTAVPLKELVSAGYLGEEDIRGLENKDATVSLSVSDGMPHAVLIRAHTSEHHEIALLADGSVEELRRQ
jgi:hypothetical protein